MLYEVITLAAAFAATRYFSVTPVRDRRELEPLLMIGKIHGMVILPQDFELRIRSADRGPLVQIITDATEPNTANFVSGYAEGVVSNWLAGRDAANPEPVRFEPRFWFNRNNFV